MKRNDKTLFLVQKAMLLALAIVFMLVIRFPLLPAAKFLEYDMGDIPLVIATLLFGAPTGVLMLGLEALVQSLTVSAASSWEGFVMHFCAGTLFLVTVSLISKIGKKNGKEKLFLCIGLVVGTLISTAVMIPLNLIFTPMYLGVEVDAVKQLMLPAIIPFNLLKGAINTIVAIATYLPLKKILKKTHMTE